MLLVNFISNNYKCKLLNQSLTSWTWLMATLWVATHAWWPWRITCRGHHKVGPEGQRQHLMRMHGGSHYQACAVGHHVQWAGVASSTVVWFFPLFLFFPPFLYSFSFLCGFVVCCCVETCLFLWMISFWFLLFGQFLTVSHLISQQSCNLFSSPPSLEGVKLWLRPVPQG